MGPSAAEQAELARDLGMGSGANPVPVPPSDRVDVNSAGGMLAAVRALASSVTVRHVPDAERLSRSGYAADAANDLLAMLRFADPYAPGSGHTRVADMLAATSSGVGPGAVTPDEAAAARERVALADQHRQLIQAVRATAWVAPGDLGPLTDPAHSPVADRLDQPTRAVWLNSLPTATRPLGPGFAVPGPWENVPEAFLDPPTGTDVSAGGATVDDVTQGWHVAALGTDMSHQVADWAQWGADEVELMLTMAVDERLEAALLADVAAGAPAAADLATAEAAVGAAWGAPDLILTNPTDRPAVVREYATSNVDAADRPRIVATSGVPAGTAYVLASGAVRGEVGPPEWLVAERPREFGKDVALMRYGQASTRVAGAVQTVAVGGP